MHISGNEKISFDHKTTKHSESTQNNENSKADIYTKKNERSLKTFDNLGPLLKTLDLVAKAHDSKTSKDVSFVTNTESQHNTLGPKLERGSETKQIQKLPDIVIELEQSPPAIQVKIPKRGRRGSEVPNKLGKLIRLGFKRKNSQEPQTDHKKAVGDLKRQNSANSMSNIDFDAELKEGHLKISQMQTRQNPKFLSNMANMASLSHVPDDYFDRQVDTRNLDVRTKTMESLTTMRKLKPFELAKSTNKPLDGVEVVLPGSQAMETAKPIGSVIVDENYFLTDAEKLEEVKSRKISNKIVSMKFLARKISENTVLACLVFCVFILIYAGIPFLLLFGAHDYQKSKILANLNFGLLGLFQGLTEVAFLYEIIDRPIRKKIREIEGKGNRLIDINDYVVINIISTIILLIFSAGTQIFAGNALQILAFKTGPKEILVTCFITTILKGIIVTIIIIFTTPKSIFEDKDLIKKEIKQISKIRDDFMEDLRNIKRNLQMAELQELYGENELRGTVLTIHRSHEVTNVADFDLRKFSQGCEDYGKEFRKIRIQSFKVFAMLSIAYLHILALYYLDKAAGEISIVPLSLLVILTFPLISFVFGLFDFFNRTTSLHLKPMKATHVIIMVALYRVLYLQIHSRGEMIGILGLKIVYKCVVYFGGAAFGSKVVNYLKTRLKLSRYGASEVEVEMTRAKVSKYTFDKFIVLQQADILFAIGTLIPVACGQVLLQSLDFDIRLKCQDIIFYVVLVSVEIILDMLLTGLFLFFKQKIVVNRGKNSKESSLLTTLIEVFSSKKYTIASSEILLMFLVLFMLLNLV